MVQRKVYLDHNATTPLHSKVKQAMCEAMEVFGNPSSLHSFGRQARQYVENAREQVASFIGAAADEIIFVGSGSEANNTVLSVVSCPSLGCNSCGTRKPHIVTTVIEHPCVLEASKCLADRGVKVSFLNVDAQGKVNLKELHNILKEPTGLVSIMMANNETGTIQDIKELARLAHEQGALFHTDAVQAAGKIPIAVNDLEVDFLTLSAHKMYGPKGVGALYVRKGVPFCPFIRGGHQERGRRAGTENTIGIIGFGEAVKQRAQEMDTERERILRYKKILIEKISHAIPDVQFNGHPVDCLPNTVNVSFEGAEGEAILLYLDLEGIAVSTGSACASGSLDPSHVLLAMGIGPEKAHGSIRLSLGRSSSEEDIDYVGEVLPKVISKIRSMSTVYARRK